MSAGRPRQGVIQHGADCSLHGSLPVVIRPRWVMDVGPRDPGVQNSRRNPSCIWRGAFASEVTRPKLALVIVESGVPQITRLNRLNASNRNSRRVFWIANV